MGLHVAVSLPATGPDRTGAEVLAAAIRAEAAGFDAVWLGDHLRHPLPMFESLTTLAAVAGATDRIGLAVSVLQLALRRTAVAAKQIATVAMFAPGRLSIGVGVGGEHRDEWAACDVPTAGRGARTSAAAAMLRAALGGEAVRFGAETEPRRLDPLPHPPVPLSFGGRRPPALDRAAAYGDGWVGWLHSPGGFAAVRAELERVRQHAQVSTRPFWYGVQVPVLLTDRTVGSGDVRLPAGSARHLVTGPPAQVAAGLRRYLDAGADRLFLSIVPDGREGEQLDRLATQVLPELRGATG